MLLRLRNVLKRNFEVITKFHAFEGIALEAKLVVPIVARMSGEFIFHVKMFLWIRWVTSDWGSGIKDFFKSV